MKRFKSYQFLLGAIALGTFLRFWHLDFKPLWLDEVLTALISLGRSYQDIPLGIAFPLSDLKEIFTLNPHASCPEIARTVAVDSTHPPLFFCLMYQWLKGIDWLPVSWVWKLRSLPALLGVGAIAALYWLNRLSFSPWGGAIAAGVMAVSPFAVYLSQEARHYTLPVLLITLALLASLQIQFHLFSPKRSPLFSQGLWVIFNTIGLYSHYFFILAYVAQILTFLIVNFSFLRKQSQKDWWQIFTVFCLPFLLFVPWLSILLGHLSRPETSWLPKPDLIAPFYQTLASLVTMVITLPVENQPLWIAVPLGFMMISFTGWVGWNIFRFFQEKSVYFPQEDRINFSQKSSRFIGCFLLIVLAEFLAIVYLLGKDITFAPRYHFVYYPAISFLIAASLFKNHANSSDKLFLKLSVKRSRFLLYRSLFIIIVVGIISSIFVNLDLSFQKPYSPQKFAQDMMIDPQIPLVMVMGYHDFQDVALGLSFALEMQKENAANTQSISLAFLPRSQGYDLVWQKLSQLTLPSSPMNLWAIAPGLKRRAYPLQLSLKDKRICLLDPNHHYRIGIPYQLYRCEPNFSESIKE